MYQRSSVQVLTQFTAQDSLSRTTHLLGSSDWFVDVTELVLNMLRIEDPRVASFGTHNSLIGLEPGKTSLYVGDGSAGHLRSLSPILIIGSLLLPQVVSEQWDGVLGRCDITVTSDPVIPGDLYVQVVSGLGMSVTASPAHLSIVTATVTAYNILYNHEQVTEAVHSHVRSFGLKLTCRVSPGGVHQRLAPVQRRHRHPPLLLS